MNGKWTGVKLYPPRPENRISPKMLKRFDNGAYFAQPKLNGSCAVVYFDWTGCKVYNRHGELMRSAPFFEIKILLPSVLVGEFMNKGKKAEDGRNFNGNLVIFDILVYDGHLTEGSTLIERIELLEKVLPARKNNYKHIYATDYPNIYKVVNYTGGFFEKWEDIVKTDAYEGLVIKRMNAKLAPCYHPANNKNWQVKIRKPTKLYSF